MKYTPNLKGIEPGQYRSGDPVVVNNHVKALDYGRADIGIISCKSSTYYTLFNCIAFPFTDHTPLKFQII